MRVSDHCGLVLSFQTTLKRKQRWIFFFSFLMQINKKVKGAFSKQGVLQTAILLNPHGLKQSYSAEKSDSFASGLFVAVSILTAEHLHIRIIRSHAHGTGVWVEPVCLPTGLRDWQRRPGQEQMSGKSQVCAVRGTQRRAFKTVSVHEMSQRTYVSNPTWMGKERIHMSKSGSEVFNKPPRHWVFFPV